MNLANIYNAIQRAKGNLDDKMGVVYGEMAPSGLTEKEVLEFIRVGAPDYTITSEDQQERAHRRETSKRMRNNFRNMCDGWVRQTQMESWEEEEKQRNRWGTISEKTGKFEPVQLVHDERAMLLSILEPDQEEEYKRRFKILAGGTPKEKIDLIMECMHSMLDGVTVEEVSNFTDEEISNDFKRIYYMDQYCSSIQYILASYGKELEPDDRQWLTDINGNMTNHIHTAMGRAEFIAEDSYEWLHLERLNRDGFVDKLGDQITGKKDPRISLLQVIVKAQTTATTTIRDVLRDTLREWGGVAANEVTWLDEKGDRFLGADFDAGTRVRDGKNETNITEECIDALYQGRTLKAVLPDGSVNVFRGGFDLRGNIKVENQQCGPEVLVDSGVQEKMKDLADGLEDADSIWYRSSKEFKEVQNTLKELREGGFQKLGDNPTKEQLEQLRQKMEKLAKVSEDYLDYKVADTKNKPNERESKRMKAVKAIWEFAESKLHFLDRVESKIEEREAARAAEKVEQEELSETIAPVLDPECKPANALAFGDKVVQVKVEADKNYPIGDPLSRLARKVAEDTIKQGAKIFNETFKKEISPDVEEEIRTYMAEAVAVNLVAVNRKKYGDKHPLVQKFQEDNEAFVTSLRDSKQFKSMVGEITKQTLTDFVMNNGAGRIVKCYEEMAEARKQASNTNANENTNKHTKTNENTMASNAAADKDKARESTAHTAQTETVSRKSVMAK